MAKNLKSLQQGTLLYDFEILVKRAGAETQGSLNAGYEYLLENNLIDGEDKEVYNILNFQDMKEDDIIPPDSFSYLVEKVADMGEGVNRNKKIDEMIPLYSVFNRVNNDRENNTLKKKIFPSVDWNENGCYMPYESNSNLTKEIYETILAKINPVLKEMKQDFKPEVWLNELERYCSYIPSGLCIEAPDISYYDHAKSMTAMASCMYLYDVEKDIHRDLKAEYRESQEWEKKEKFLFVSGEFTGIQEFIYTITSKMAMKSLRGRSFYLELFTEHIIDEVLSSLSLNRANLIYSGGSHFYMLLPNTDKSSKLLGRYKDIINDFLLEEVGTKLYFEIATIPITAEELENGLNDVEKKENSLGTLFKKTFVQADKGKMNRYSKEQLEELFNEDSCVNKVKSSEKECLICRKPASMEELEENSGEDGFERCNSCNSFIELGQVIPRLYSKTEDEKHFLAEMIEEEKQEQEKCILKFPLYFEENRKNNQEISVILVKEKEICEKEKIHRYYAFNSFYRGDERCKNIFVGNYNIGSQKTDGLIEFSELVEKAKGIRRLAVLRADVDNLGSLFQNGFKTGDNKSDGQYFNLLRSSVLSRNLSDFFRKDINVILEKKPHSLQKNQGFTNYCSTIRIDETMPRDIVIVYSGGDDVFMIGTWNDIVEFAVDLRQTFREFTNNKVTLSAGIGFFSEHFPVYQMANYTGMLEKLAKEYTKAGDTVPTKDAVALFGHMNDERLNHVYPWDEFIDEVLYGKYQYIKSMVDFKEDSGNKVFVGTSKWYKLMDLITHRLINDDRIDIVRFAYTVARIKHTKENQDKYEKLKKQLLEWMRNEKDAKQLLTAINLIMYEEREGTK